MTDISAKITCLVIIAIVLFIMWPCSCVTVFPRVPSVKDQDEKSCQYYLYHKHYEGGKQR
jgi:hypothetical protein